MDKRRCERRYLFALFDGFRVSDVAIENICLDGNKANNEFLNGNYVGCMFLRESNRINLKKVTARNFNGDGISWQVCHDVRAEDCHSHDHAGYGEAHPGSGSQRTVVTGSKLERNDIGFFFCWDVKWGLVENNSMLDNKRFGTSSGTTIRTTSSETIRCRTAREGRHLSAPGAWSELCPSRNQIETNRVVDSGGETGVAVDIEKA